MNITAEQLKALAPNGKDLTALAQAFNETCAKFEINTLRRVRYFITHCVWETEYLTAWVENLYYSTPERIAVVWDQRFTMDRSKVGTISRIGVPFAYAPDFVKNPGKLGDQVYANRMGNNATNGFEFRGRGAMHLTGAKAYEDFGHDVYADSQKFLTSPDLVAQAPYNLISAGWFWRTRDLNALADKDEFTKSTAIVNGSTVTAGKRLELLNKVNKVIVG